MSMQLCEELLLSLPLVPLRLQPSLEVEMLELSVGYLGGGRRTGVGQLQSSHEGQLQSSYESRLQSSHEGQLQSSHEGQLQSSCESRL